MALQPQVTWTSKHIGFYCTRQCRLRLSVRLPDSPSLSLCIQLRRRVAARLAPRRTAGRESDASEPHSPISCISPRNSCHMGWSYSDHRGDRRLLRADWESEHASLPQARPGQAAGRAWCSSPGAGRAPRGFGVAPLAPHHCGAALGYRRQGGAVGSAVGLRTTRGHSDGTWPGHCCTAGRKGAGRGWPGTVRPRQTDTWSDVHTKAVLLRIDYSIIKSGREGGYLQSRACRRCCW